ncbi:MAG: Ldh family oxidoreductase [Alphaproteobacteria bacterium]|nr:Ldh family oxidoreductase [Alphaproteobacteria bacterium]
MPVTLTLDEVEQLSFRTLVACGTAEANARSVAMSVRASEADAIHSHGLARQPTYCEHARIGKIKGDATPTVKQTGPAALMADARDGFAHPAIDLALPELMDLAHQTGIAALGVTNSYNCGVVGYHVERIAASGLLALGFVNAPASIAPYGGRTGVFGTNPLAFAAPRTGAHRPLVIDQSSSVVARSEVIVHANEGKDIPEGWALDEAGQPTTDPKAGLKGTMVPMGGHKGAGQALMVEVMAACLTGATLAVHASSFADNLGGAPRTGQCFIALSPAHFGGTDVFETRLTDLLAAIEAQDGARLPGARRQAARLRTANEGIRISDKLHERLTSYLAA